MEFSQILLENENVNLAGLGSRDSLRLEAGLCLYGHDLDDSTTPVEAGLSWTIGKQRRVKGGFLGADIILKQLKEGPLRRRIGLVASNGAPARGILIQNGDLTIENAEIYSQSGDLVGKVTSGCPAPSLKQNIAMAYVNNGFHKAGTELLVKVRSKMQPMSVVKMPFVSSNYYRGLLISLS